MLQIYTNQTIITGLTMQNVQPAGCYSWIKRDFEADFVNIEHVSIMNDNWDFDCFFWGGVRFQRKRA